MMSKAHIKDILLKLEGVSDLLAYTATDNPALFVLQNNLNECVEELYGIVGDEEQTSCVG